MFGYGIYGNDDYSHVVALVWIYLLLPFISKVQTLPVCSRLELLSSGQTETQTMTNCSGPLKNNMFIYHPYNIAPTSSWHSNTTCSQTSTHMYIFTWHKHLHNQWSTHLTLYSSVITGRKHNNDESSTIINSRTTCSFVSLTILQIKLGWHKLKPFLTEKIKISRLMFSVSNYLRTSKQCFASDKPTVRECNIRLTCPLHCETLSLISLNAELSFILRWQTSAKQMTC